MPTRPPVRDDASPFLDWTEFGRPPANHVERPTDVERDLLSQLLDAGADAPEPRRGPEPIPGKEQPVSQATLAAYLGDWFLREDPQGWEFVAEIAVSLIPIIGDGRDVVRYLVAEYRKGDLSGHTLTDDALFVLSCVGLGADIATIASRGRTAGVSAAAKLLKLVLSLLKTLGHAVAGEQIAARILRAIHSLDGAAHFFEQWKALIDHLLEFASNPKQIREVVDKLGLVIVAPQLLELVLQAARKLSADHFVRLLKWIAHMPEDLA
jgi:hypothetical protein